MPASTYAGYIGRLTINRISHLCHHPAGIVVLSGAPDFLLRLMADAAPATSTVDAGQESRSCRESAYPPSKDPSRAGRRRLGRCSATGRRPRGSSRRYFPPGEFPPTIVRNSGTGVFGALVALHRPDDAQDLTLRCQRDNVGGFLLGAAKVSSVRPLVWLVSASVNRLQMVARRTVPDVIDPLGSQPAGAPGRHPVSWVAPSGSMRPGQ